jgi:hypothetical protein
MTERPLIEELNDLARQVADCPDETVADLGAYIAAWYRRERLVAGRERMRDRLRALLAWARENGRL